MNYRFFTFPFTLALLMSGCASTITPLKPSSFPVSNAAPLALKVGISDDEQGSPVLDEGFKPAPADDLSRFEQILRESKVFKEVRQSLLGQKQGGVDMVFYPRLVTKYVEDPHLQGKALAGALTLCLACPFVFPMHEAVAAKARLSIKDSSGEDLKQYDEAQGVRITRNGGYDERLIADATRSAMDNVLAKLVQDIINDRPSFEQLAQRLHPGQVAGKLTFPAPAPALSSVDSPSYRLSVRSNDFAVVVGIEKYSNDLPDAQFAEHDAAAVKSNLLALGYPERNIKFLTGQRATLSGLASYVEDWLPRNVKADSKVFFYFSGHGAPDPDSGQAYLVPWDGNPSYLATTAYPLKKLYAKLGALKAKQVIVALDSCFSGAGGRSVLAKGTRPLVNKVDMDVAADGKLILFAASSAKETTSTLDDQGHGIFTYYFLKGLGGEAKDDSGVISAQGLYDYLKPKVQDAASRQNRDQTPVLEGAAQDSELVRFK